MQGDAGAGDASGFQRGEQGRREMQPGGRCCDGAGFAREQGLVVGAVGRLGMLAPDIGRQRHLALAFEGIHQRRARGVETQRHLARVAPFDRFRRQTVAELDTGSGLQLLRRPGEGQPGRGIEPLVQGDFDAARADAPAQARGDDAGVVDDHEVARAQQVGKLAHDAILQAVGRDLQQAGSIARAGRMVGDQCARQIEIERVDPHAPSGPRSAPARPCRSSARRRP